MLQYWKPHSVVHYPNPEMLSNVQDLWLTFADIIGPTHRWPVTVRRLFWTPILNYLQRLLVAAFVYVNGCNPEMFMEWVDPMHLCRDTSAIRHIDSLFTAFDNVSWSGRQRYYAYNVTFGRLEFIDGTVKRKY